MKHFILSLSLITLAISATAQRFEIPYSGTTAIADYIYELPRNVLPADFDVNTHAIQHGSIILPIERSVDIFGSETFISIMDITTDRRGRVVIPTVSIVRGQATDYPKRTYAEITHKTGGRWARNPRRRQLDYVGGEWTKTNFIRVPDEDNVNSGFVKYEGPGWESDKVGYRFYLDWRNATDIFGKKTPEMSLHRAGVDPRESYHEMQDWGMDILKVGNAVGVGGFAFWTGERAYRMEIYDSLISQVTADGKLRSQVKTYYHGWDHNNSRTNKVDRLTSLISIDAGSRASYQQLLLSHPIDNICTGIVKDPDGEYFEHINESGEWSYIATFGKQALNDPADYKLNLGMAVLFRTGNLREVTSDNNNWVVVLNPENLFLDYYYLGAWELEPNGIKTKDDFINYLNELTKTLR